MSFGGAFDGVPRIHDYATALAAHDRLKPWRGSDARPLRRRAETHKSIRKLHDGSIALRHYSTDVLTYHPDGTMTFRLYPSQSTNQFVGALTPGTATTTLHRGRMYLALATVEGTTRYYRRASGEPITVARVSREGDPKRWRVVNFDQLETDQTYALDKARAKEIRGILKPFEQWVSAVSALSDGVIELPTEEPPPQLAKGRHNMQFVAEYLMSGDAKPEEYPYLVNCVLARRWKQGTWGMRIISNWKNRLRKEAYKQGGAVQTVDVPLGELARRSAWE